MGIWRMIGAGMQCVARPLHAPVGPIHFQLEPFVGCNLTCLTCQVPAYERTQRMTLDQFRTIFDKVRPLRIGLSGAGEPMLNKDLLPMVRHAKQGGAKVLTTTNFSIASDRLEDILDSGLDLIKVSLDAAQPETYTAIRGKDLLGQITEDLRRLNELKRRRGQATPYVRLQFVIQHGNLDEIEELVPLAQRVSADSVYYQTLSTLLIPERKDELSAGVSPLLLGPALARAQAAADAAGIGTNAALIAKDIERYWAMRYDRADKPGPPQRVCLLPWFSIYVTVEGDVQPCCSFGGSREAMLGSLLTQSLEEVWNGDGFRDLRRRAKQRKLCWEVCCQCLPNRLRDFASLSSVLPGFFPARGGKRAADGGMD